METKRYFRSKTDRVFAGVCGGLAEYFAIDPLLIRLLFVVLALVGGGGVLIYIILWIAAQENPGPYYKSQDPARKETPQQPSPEPQPASETTQTNPPSVPYTKRHKPQRGLIGGLVLITLGILFLISEFVPSVDFGDLWPILLVVIGVGLLLRSLSGKNENN